MEEQFKCGSTLMTLRTKKIGCKVLITLENLYDYDITEQESFSDLINEDNKKAKLTTGCECKDKRLPKKYVHYLNKHSNCGYIFR